MRKKLLLLDLALIALVALAGARVRQSWLEARKRESVVLGRPINPLPPPPYQPLAVPPALSAVDYNDVAQRMVFHSERNPTVVIEVAAPPPMPALPVVYGVIDLGDGPVAIMSPGPSQRTSEVRAGEVMGEFKLLAVNRDEIVLEWNGKRVERKLSEVLNRNASAPPQAAGGAQAPAAAPRAQANVMSTASPSGPGVDMGGLRACKQGDTSPPGTVADGFKKVVTDSPFGKICRWEPLK